MIGFALPGQVVFNGVVLGLTYGVLAIGVILVFRSSRVINFAIAEMGAFGAVLLARLVVNWDVPYLVAFVACVAVGALIGAAVELGVVRRLFEAPRVILLVATIGVAQVLLFAQFSLPDLTAYTDYPTPILESWHVGDVIVRGSQVLVLVVIPLLTAGLAFFLNRTRYGTAIRASAANADAARLAGINIKRMSTLVWVLTGVLATVGAILTAPLNSATANDIGGFGPSLLLRVLAAALIGRMTSLPWAVAGGVAIGVAETTIFYNSPNETGLLDMVLLAVVLLALHPARPTGPARGRQRPLVVLAPGPARARSSSNICGGCEGSRSSARSSRSESRSCRSSCSRRPRTSSCSVGYSCTRSSRCRSRCSRDGRGSSPSASSRSSGSAR